MKEKMKSMKGIRRRVFAWVLTLVMVLSLMPMNSMTVLAEPTTWYSSGTGTEANPYIISDMTQLNNFAAYVNGGQPCDGKFIKLADDFDEDGTLNTSIGHNDMFDESYHFKGTFDGNGKTVNLDINFSEIKGAYVGMFGYVEGATIKNVTTAGTITVTFTLAGLKVQAGGITGFADFKYVDGTNDIKTKISDCYSTATITTNTAGSITEAGGIIGCMNATEICNSYYAGTISVTNAGDNSTYIGGIVGNMTDDCSVENSYSVGNIADNRGTDKAAYVGGILGYINGSIAVKNCYSAGTITIAGTDKIYRGGIAGYIYSGCTATFDSSFFLTGLADNGIGTGSATGTPTALADTVMKGTGTTDLLAKLNEWVTANNSSNKYHEWEIKADTNSGYPIFKMAAPEPNYLTFTAVEAGSSVTFNWSDCENVSYSTDGGESWSSYEANTEITLDAVGDRVSFKGKNVRTDRGNHFIITGKVAASGSVTSLIDENGGDAGVALNGADFSFMFEGCTGLTKAPELPATTLAASCYEVMFKGCTALTTAPELPATTLADNCYGEMFADCTNLAVAPELPATTLKNNCYDTMFKGCESLLVAPELPATTLTQYCYRQMFQGCKKLKSMPTIAATTLANNCCYEMFKGCTSLKVVTPLLAENLKQYCYFSMFEGCTSLVVAPKLPATTLDEYCYEYMFKGCSNLLVAPKLPAMTLKRECYRWMFQSCTSLTRVPELPATTLAEMCYAGMFSSCANLEMEPAPNSDFTDQWKIPVADSDVWAWNNQMFAACDKVVINEDKVPAFNTTYYQRKKETHTFTYAAGTSADANKIIATCNESTCTLPDKQVTLTLLAEDSQTPGSVNEASISDAEITAWVLATEKSFPEIVYYVSGSSTKTTVQDSGAEYEGGAPSAVGTYEAWITFNGNTAKKAFSITSNSGGGHSHSGWTYNAQDNKITAICGAGGCTLSTNPTLTLNVADAVYTGSAIEASISETEKNAWTTAGLTVPTIEYYQGTTKLSAAPVNVGSYTAKITVSTYNATKNYSITKKTNIQAPSASTFTAIAPTSAGGSDGKITGADTTMEYSVDNGSTWKAVTGTQIVGLSAGIVKIRLKDTGNEEASAPVDVTVPDGSGGSGGSGGGYTPHVHSWNAGVVATAPTCVAKGVKTISCSGCSEKKTEDIEKLEHDWSGEWKVIKEATTSEEGKRQQTCAKGCGTTRNEVIPKLEASDGETGNQPEEDKNVGKLEKDAEVTPEAPVDEVTMNNSKSDLMSADGIFTEEEKSAVAAGENARVWLEIDALDESTIAAEDKTKIEAQVEVVKKAAEEAASLGVSETEKTQVEIKVTYFDANLFKKVGGGEKTKISNPGTMIEIGLKVPENLLNKDITKHRSYKILRMHDGVAEILEAVFDKLAGELVFKTDRFSTYAILTVDTDYVAVTKVNVTPEQATLTKAGETVALSATVEPQNASDKSLTWTSSNPKVAKVNSKGKVTAVANGTTTITAKADGKKATIKITVKLETKPTKVQKAKNSLEINGEFALIPKKKSVTVKWGKVEGADGYQVFVQYCGMDMAKAANATITKAGIFSVNLKKLNGKAVDNTKHVKGYVIAYKNLDGKKVVIGKSIVGHAVGVKSKDSTDAKSIKLVKNVFTLKNGKTAQIKATTVKEDKKKALLNHTAEFRYATTDKKVATVSADGKITAVGKGTCTIYVYAVNGFAKKVKITVK